MNTALEIIRKDLTQLWAAITTLKQLDSNKAKGTFLVDHFRKHSRQVWYFKVAIGIDVLTEPWLTATQHGIDEELWDIRCDLLRGGLSINVPAPVVKKALDIAEPKTNIEVDITGGLENITADLRCNEHKVGSMVLYKSKHLAAALAFLRAAGVNIKVPNHMSIP